MGMFGQKSTTQTPKSVIPGDLTGPRAQYGDFVQRLIASLSGGGGLPAAPTDVAPLDPRIAGLFANLQDVTGQAGAPGATAAARTTLDEIIRTGLPSTTAGTEEALGQRKALLDRERSANVTESFGARGGRFGSPLAVGLGRGQAQSDVEFLNTIAALRYGSSEAAASRRQTAATAAPGFEAAITARALAPIQTGFSMAPFLQGQAQLPFQLQREEAIRRQQEAIKAILPFLIGFPPVGTESKTTGGSGLASILGPLLGIGASFIPGVGPFVGPAIAAASGAGGLFGGATYT